MKKLIISGLYTLTILFGTAFAWFTATGPADQPLQKAVIQSLGFTALCAVVIAVVAISKRKKFMEDIEANDAANDAAPQPLQAAQSPIKMALSFFIYALFFTMALRPEQELIETATIIARVSGWIMIVMIVIIDFIIPIFDRKKK